MRGDPLEIQDFLSPLTLKELERHADRLLRAPAAANYFRPIEQTAQVWIAGGNRGPGPRWFDADLRPFGSVIPKPVGGLWTSSRVGSLVSGWVSYLQDGLAGYPPPYHPWELRVDASARIYEINDAVSWRWLSTTYPRELDGRLAPDWIGVSRDWDGVHLSTMGLLLTYGVTWPDVAALRGWDCESTLWLRWSSSRVVALPVVAEEQLFRPEAWLPFLSDIGDPSPPGTSARRSAAG